LFDQLDSVLPHLEEIYFAGGEPLIMEEHYRLLDFLIERGCFNVALSYSTNLSVTRYKERDVLRLWNRFPKVKVRASIDAIGARGELMRKEQNWQETVDNARRIRSTCPHVEFCTDTTVSIFNVLHLPELYRELLALDFAPAGKMATHILQDPPFYNIRVLPIASKTKVRDAMARLERWLTTRLSGTPDCDAVLAFHRGQIGEIVSYMDSEDWSNLLPKFRETTARLDTLPAEATRDAIPELASILAAPDRSTWQSLKAWLRQT
jgi:hypothetical protein